MSKLTERLPKLAQEQAQSILVEAKLTQKAFVEQHLKSSVESRVNYSRHDLGRFLRGEPTIKPKFHFMREKFIQLAKELKLKCNHLYLIEDGNQEGNNPVDLIFLYNDEDKNPAQRILQKLEKQGLNVWSMDKMKYGSSWQKAEEYIEIVGSVAVWIGQNNTGPWTNTRQFSLLKKFHDRMREEKDLTIIPMGLKTNVSSDYLEGEKIPDYLKNIKVAIFNHHSYSTIKDLIEVITKNQLLKSKFLSIFGDIKIAFIPTYDVKSSNIGNQTEDNIYKKGATVNLERSQAKTINCFDSDTYIATVFLFEQMKIPIFPYKGDHEWKELINSRKKQQESYILIGLSNGTLKNFGNPKNTSGKYFNVCVNKIDENEYLYSFSINSNTFNQQENIIYNESKDKDYDYALFAKFKYEKSKTIIMCGGITEIATKRLGLYIRDNWENIYIALRLKKGSELHHDDLFAVAIKTHKRQLGKPCIIDRICINGIVA